VIGGEGRSCLMRLIFSATARVMKWLSEMPSRSAMRVAAAFNDRARRKEICFAYSSLFAFMMVARPPDILGGMVDCVPICGPS